MDTKVNSFKFRKVFWACMTGMLLMSKMTSNATGLPEVAAENMESGQQTDETQIEKEIQPTELDLGDYQTEMTVGEKQLLTVTILPVDATVQELNYHSSNTEVATINGMGRITALKKGQTRITVTCGTVSAFFDVSVKEAENTEVKVTELDLGDCPKEITIGTSQILNIAVIPADATNISLEYKSSNPDVASVNALGRLTGNQLGTAEITVNCGKVKGKFEVKVVEDDSKEKIIEVEDVEIGNYDGELNVDSILNISATVLPSDATDAKLTYKSSNPEIATVNSSGEVKGIVPGEVVIYVSAGNVTKQVPITVKIATTVIELNSDYQVMKIQDTFQIKAQVQPEGASRAITYKSMNPEVASVSSSGLITAKSCGNTAIVVDNGDMQVSVTVIVNEEGIEDQSENDHTQKSEEMSKNFPDEVTVEECPIITTEMLKYFYEQEKALTIRGEKYTIYLDGKNIVNFENELETELIFREVKNGFTIMVNNEEKLCGKLTIDISQWLQGEKYLYLYNKEKGKYQKLNTEDISTLRIDSEGMYLLTSKPLSGNSVNSILIVIGCLGILIGLGVYVGAKKRYWFW